MVSRYRDFRPYHTNIIKDPKPRSLTSEFFKGVTYEQAFDELWIRKKALQISGDIVPEEFTQFVLRRLAVCERGCRHFEAKLTYEVRNYLKKLVGLQNTDIQVETVHPKSRVKPNGFLGVVVRYFFRKLIFNLKKESGRFEYAENYACLFPFKVFCAVPSYDIYVFELFDGNFYSDMETFLKEHFNHGSFIEARKICYLFLSNIRHFQATKFSEEELLQRLRIILYGVSVDENKIPNYLDTFPRLNDKGAEWFGYLYNQFKIIRKVYQNIDEPISRYDVNYFRTLPETNFVDLYSLLDDKFYTFRRRQYAERFQKYLFFFVHALHNDSHPVFFIDDVLFECLKCLQHFKTTREDVSLLNDIAMLSLVHLRTKREMEDCNTDYRIHTDVLQNIKTYTLRFSDVQNVHVDVELKTDYLHGWMFLRTKDTCFEMCYSVRERKFVQNFLDRILCAVLCPDDDPIKYIAIYNAYTGQETRIVMPKNIERVRNFVRISNNYDFTQTTPEDEFLTKDLEDYFETLADTRLE